MSNTHRHIGDLAICKHTRWKSASKKTIAELAVSGKLTPQQIQNAFSSGRLSKSAFRKVFWESANISNLDSNALSIINKYAHILL